jgi:hypothetical protein
MNGRFISWLRSEAVFDDWQLGVSLSAIFSDVGSGDAESHVVATSRQKFVNSLLHNTGPGVFNLHLKALFLGGLVSAPLTPWDTGSTRERINLNIVFFFDVSLELTNGQRSRVHDNLTEDSLWIRHTDDRSHGHNIVLLGLDQLSSVGLGEQPRRSSQVDESVLIFFNVSLSLDKLVDLGSDAPSDHGSGGGNGRDNLTSNHLSLVEVALSDLVVTGTHVGSTVNELNVEVLVVVLLEFA